MGIFGQGLLNGQQQQPLPRVPWANNPLVTSVGLGLLGGRNINEGLANAAAAAPAGMAAKSSMQAFMQKRQDEEAAKAAQRAAWNAGMKWKSAGDWNALSPEDQAALSAAPEIAAKFMPKDAELPNSVQEYQYGLGDPAYNDWRVNLSQASAPKTIGTPPPGYRVTYDEAGNPVAMEPIPGGPADTSVQDTNRRENQVRKADIVLQDIDRTLEKVDRIPTWTTGFAGDWLKGIPGTGANDAARLIDSVKANIGFEQLNQMRSESKTGAALGSVQVVELQFLQSVMGSLEQSQSPEQLAFNLKRLKNAYLDIVHGPGNGPPRESLEGVGDDGWTEVEPGIRIREKP